MSRLNKTVTPTGESTERTFWNLIVTEYYSRSGQQPTRREALYLLILFSFNRLHRFSSFGSSLTRATYFFQECGSGAPKESLFSFSASPLSYAPLLFLAPHYLFTFFNTIFFKIKSPLLYLWFSFQPTPHIVFLCLINVAVTVVIWTVLQGYVRTQPQAGRVRTEKNKLSLSSFFFFFSFEVVLYSGRACLFKRKREGLMPGCVLFSLESIPDKWLF
jgi:hypothetical protein